MIEVLASAYPHLLDEARLLDEASGLAYTPLQSMVQRLLIKQGRVVFQKHFEAMPVP